MKLVEAESRQVRQMMAWFPDRHSCQMWGGPSFRFPYTETTFFEDTRCAELPWFTLIGDAGELLGFGQYYSRVGRCHVGRLAVSPAHRNRGAGRTLMAELIELGSRTLAATECSLFVVTENPAKRLYERLGFARTQYPLDDPHVLDFEYMVAPVGEVLKRARQSAQGSRASQ